MIAAESERSDAAGEVVIVRPTVVPMGRVKQLLSRRGQDPKPAQIYVLPGVRSPEGRSRSRERRVRRASRAASRDGPDEPSDNPDDDVVRARRGRSR